MPRPRKTTGRGRTARIDLRETVVPILDELANERGSPRSDLVHQAILYWLQYGVSPPRWPPSANTAKEPTTPNEEHN